MSERCLVRPNDLSPNTYADVVGLIPPSAHQLIQSNREGGKNEDPWSCVSGRVDSNSKLGFASLPGGKIYLWKNISCTLSEPLQAATICEEFLYPNDTMNIEDNVKSASSTLDERLIAIVSRSSGTNANMPPLLELFACTSNGILSRWNAVLLHNNSTTKANLPDDIVSIPLQKQNGEYVTYVAPLPSTRNKTGNYGGILIATNKARIFTATKNTKHVHLQIKQVDLAFRTSSTESSSVINKVLGRMWYSDDNSATSEQDDSSYIFAMHNLPKVQNYDISTARSKLDKNRISDNSGIKAMKRESPNVYITIQANLIVTLWSFMEPMPSDKQRGQSIGEKIVGVGSFSDQVKTAIWQEMKLHDDNMESNALSLTLLASNVSQHIFDDECLLVLAVRVSLNQSHHRLYLLQYTIHLDKVSEFETSNDSIISFRNHYWLSRYSTDISAKISCSGLVVTYPDTCHKTSEFVVYSIWQSQSSSATDLLHENIPLVTVTAIHTSSSPGPHHTPHIYDIELPKNIAPALIGIGTTPQTEGALLLSQSGCIINTRIKITNNLSNHVSSSSSVFTKTSDTSLEEVATKQTLINHILSSFAIHPCNTKSRSNKEKISAHDMSSSVPPSLLHSPSQTLNAAVIETSLYFACKGCDSSHNKSGMLQERIFDNLQSLSNRDLLKEKLNMHINFCNFLNHSGIYKRLTDECKSDLADHGEMIASSLALYPVVEKSIAQNQNDDDLKKAYLIFLKKISSDSTDLIHHLNELFQSLIPLSPAAKSQAEKTILLDLAYILYTTFSETMIYRAKRADILYDLRERGHRECNNVNFNAFPWTSSKETRSLLGTHLTDWRDCMQLDHLSENTEAKRAIEVLALTLLDGFHVRENFLKEKSKAYHRAKVLAIPLLLKISGERKALAKSVEHLYFEGIVEICDTELQKAYKKTRTLSNNQEEKQDANSQYTLEHLLIESNNSLLHQAVDPETGLNFAEYVLNWYKEKNNYGMILELGKNCPLELQQVLKQDSAQQYRWMENIREENWGSARSSLLELVNVDSSTVSRQYQKHSLDDRALLLSLAKLTSKIELSENHNMDLSGKQIDNQVENEKIVNGLILVRCQEILFSLDSLASEEDLTVALSPKQLLNISINQIKTQTSSYNDRVKAALTGLAVSEILSSKLIVKESEDEESIDSACKVWSTLIECELQKIWNTLVGQGEVLTDDEVKLQVLGSLFYNVEMQYYASRCSFSKTSTNLKTDLSFGQNEIVRKKVLQEIGAGKHLTRILNIAAKLSRM